MRKRTHTEIPNIQRQNNGNKPDFIIDIKGKSEPGTNLRTRREFCKPKLLKNRYERRIKTLFLRVFTSIPHD